MVDSNVNEKILRDNLEFQARLKRHKVAGTFGKSVTIKSSASSGQSYNNVFAVSYDGEKNLGEIGPIKEYWPDYHALRLRSWQAYLESEVAQMVIGKYIKWVVGAGLKLQAEPAKVVLKSEKITLNTEEFNEVSEARFAVYSKSKSADYSGQKSLHKIARVAYKNAILGGDVLVILRFIDGQIKVQLIDGCHVRSPLYGTDGYAQVLSNGHTIRHGIELSPTGEHVAYHVCKKDYTFERIPAKVEGTDLLQAFLLYGLEYRLDNHRGLPLISAMLETLKKLERYKEATVGSAEEVAKIAWQVVHQVYSTGENPFADRLAKAFDADASEDLAEDINGIKLANKVAASTNKTAVNNPPGAEVKPITSTNKELYFEPFYNVNIGLVCAAINIPKDVATSQYNGNFSASRAALKDWEHTINTDRCDAPAEFYQNVYNFWLHVQILTNKVNAPGYINAFQENNHMVLDSYRNSRWVGANVPHIDPLKEVNAERAKLGASGLDIPLTTVEQATEALNGGDSDQNMAQYAEELKESKRLGIQSIIPESTATKKKGED
jgi:capsid protein